MTNVPLPHETDPRQQLIRSRELARAVRSAQRATWFPLLVFALLTFVSIPIIRLGHRDVVACRATGTLPSGEPGRVCVVRNTATWIYWPIALVLAYIVIAAFYRRRASARGLSSRVQPYVVAGIAITVVLTAVATWASHRVLVGQRDILGWTFDAGELYRFVGPAATIGLALLVLAYVERSVALVGVTLAYLFVVVAPYSNQVASTSPWGFAPRIALDGAVLLAAAIGFAFAQRPLRTMRPASA